MTIIKLWVLPDGHELAVMRHTARAQRRDGEAPFQILWLQKLDGELGKIKELAIAPTEAEALTIAEGFLPETAGSGA